ncbi:TIGR00645 family protein [Octadecabacter temperatus]|uniref:UPF0114 protein OSB_06180 n=1 Tax=Octadecabacter temperatus TaxID=1458307 RepID=A0A0K0Y2L8_9RHOB|nr:TIGR00645 family protein [Octadecabacter temperatus]AKS45179.1 hypothetical protein OSB_06180 [Octadecabacter temperatus]SIN87718.1 TIGR00645 family protein [Octadecabacter temperatus]
MSDENQQDEKLTVEEHFERGLFASRWLLAPMYFGLVVSLAMLTLIFGRELLYYAPKILTLSSDKSILVVLTLIDLTLAGNLLLIVLFSGYENFVSKFDLDENEDKPDWMGTVDYSGLKMKLIASIVAISAIHLLKKFMEIGIPEADALYTPEKLKWLVIIHMSFVLSGIILAGMDYISAAAKMKMKEAAKK